MEININCDLGESSKFHSTENDPLLLKVVNSANIACGYHAGDKATMEKTIEISKKNNVSIGAHPSFNDPENFGRERMSLSSQEIEKLIFDQYNILQEIASKHRENVTHIKPHGALNNMACEDLDLATTLAKTIKAIKFISVNQLHKKITIAALRITELIIPNADPTKYIGTNIQVAGSNIVKVKTALAPTNNIVSIVSHQNENGLS